MQVERLYEEFYKQGDRERKLNMKVTTTTTTRKQYIIDKHACIHALGVSAMRSKEAGGRPWSTVFHHQDRYVYVDILRLRLVVRIDTH